MEECQWHGERLCNYVTVFRVLHTQQGHAVLIQQFPFFAIHSTVKGQTSPMIVSNSSHCHLHNTEILKEMLKKQEQCCRPSVLVTQLRLLASISCRWFCQTCKFRTTDGRCVSEDRIKAQFWIIYCSLVPITFFPADWSSVSTVLTLLLLIIPYCIGFLC